MEYSNKVLKIVIAILLFVMGLIILCYAIGLFKDVQDPIMEIGNKIKHKADGKEKWVKYTFVGFKVAFVGVMFALFSILIIVLSLGQILFAAFVLINALKGEYSSEVFAINIAVMLYNILLTLLAFALDKSWVYVMYGITAGVYLLLSIPTTIMSGFLLNKEKAEASLN